MHHDGGAERPVVQRVVDEQRACEAILQHPIVDHRLQRRSALVGARWVQVKHVARRAKKPAVARPVAKEMARRVPARVTEHTILAVCVLSPTRGACKARERTRRAASDEPLPHDLKNRVEVPIVVRACAVGGEPAIGARSRIRAHEAQPHRAEQLGVGIDVNALQQAGEERTAVGVKEAVQPLTLVNVRELLAAHQPTYLILQQERHRQPRARSAARPRAHPGGVQGDGGEQDQVDQEAKRLPGLVRPEKGAPVAHRRALFVHQAEKALGEVQGPAGVPLRLLGQRFDQRGRLLL